MQFGLCIEMALSKLPFEQRLKQAAAAGFQNVEMWFVDMSYKGTPEDLKALAKKYGVRITNTVIGSPDGSVGGGLTNPKNRSHWLARAKSTLDFTKRAGIGATIVCTGNDARGLSDAAMLKSVVDGLRATVKLAEAAGITLLLEPLNTRYDHAGYWLSSSDRGAEICRRIHSPRLKLLFDCYHMQIMEGDLLKHIERNLDVIGHFHSAGVPGRNELFKGEINYPFLIAGIEQLGYRGVFGLEYQPTMPDMKSLKETLRYLRA
jgi:hydroxypyruvate isomerase